MSCALGRWLSGNFGSVLVLCKTSSRPSGSVPSAPSTSPFSETSLGVSLPETSSSSSLPLGGQGKSGGSRGAPSVFRGASSPPARLWSSERGGSASGHLSGASGLAPSSPPPSGGGGAEIALLLQTPFSRFSKSVDSPNSHRTFHDVRIRGSHQSLAPAFYPPASHALRGVDRGRIRGLGRMKLALVDVAVSRSSSRSRSRGRVRVGRLSSASLSSRGRSRRERSRSFGRYRSRRERTRSPARQGERRDRSLSRVARVTARGQAGDCLLPLPVREPRKQDGWPDGEPGRVWRRLPLSLLWRLGQRWTLLLLQEGRP